MKRVLLLALVLGGGMTLEARAQSDDLRIFGYFQSQFSYSDNEIVVGPMVDEYENSSFSTQHLNLLFAKNLTSDFSAFVNLEFVNSYDSQWNWGTFGIEEAWVRYSHDRRFGVKAGSLVPTFGNLNTIKSRAPLLPYIFRPAVYEGSLDPVLSGYEYVPQQAYVEVSGSLPTGDLSVDYAAYVGNSTPENVDPAGTDTSKAKLFGGRLGVRYDQFKLGVSGTLDRDNYQEFGLGEVDRARVGVDASFSISRVFAEGEYIHVSYSETDAQETMLAFLAANSGGQVTGDLGRKFYYGLVGVNLTDALYGYGIYSYLDSEDSAFLADGITIYSAGAGYRLNDAVTLKGQYTHVTRDENQGMSLLINSFQMAVSATF